jgi:predicted nuclease of restriction endonuclease-like RecB superfamily
MLTADLVDARRRNGELVLRALDTESRVEALALARTYLEAARTFVGKRREELEEAWNDASTEAEPKRVKLAAGLRKLAADACSFEAETSIDPVELRRVLFTHASEVRRTASPPSEEDPAAAKLAQFDRAAVLADAARMLGLEPDVVERAMFADLKSEHLLREAPLLDAESLVEAWELGQAQAVLLTAVRITCDVSSASAGLVRAFFAKLKFHKLLFSAERLESGWRVVIDGPYSMFDSVTKYGLRLAFVLPALRALEKWSLVADIRWGKTREALVFRLTSEDDEPRALEPNDGLHLSDEVRELVDGINALDAGWRARPATVLLDVPGAGICIPDLELSLEDDAKSKGAKRRAMSSKSPPVYVEVLGYWSRDAVFRRVELAERGLAARVVFAVSSRLRVSADVLDESAQSCLYVYKGKMSPRAIIERAAKTLTR